MSEQHLRQALEDLASQAADREDLVAVAERRFRRGRRWRAVLAGVAAVVVVVAGVAVIRPMIGVHGPLPIGSGLENPPFPTYHGANGMMAGIGPVRLVLVDGCVYVKSPIARGRLGPVIFPDRTKWNPATQQITLDGETVTIGDRVSGGGGSVDLSTAHRFHRWRTNIPPACHYDKTDPGAFWAVDTISRVPAAKRTPGENRPFAIARFDDGGSGRIHGKLVLDGGCVYLDTPKGAQIPLMFADETKWDAAKQQINHSGMIASIGDRVLVTGRYVKTASAVYIPDGCHDGRTPDKAFWQVYGISRSSPGRR